MLKLSFVAIGSPSRGSNHGSNFYRRFVGSFTDLKV